MTADAKLWDEIGAVSLKYFGNGWWLPRRWHFLDPALEDLFLTRRQALLHGVVPGLRPAMAAVAVVVTALLSTGPWNAGLPSRPLASIAAGFALGIVLGGLSVATNAAMEHFDRLTFLLELLASSGATGRRSARNASTKNLSCTFRSSHESTSMGTTLGFTQPSEGRCRMPRTSPAGTSAYESDDVAHSSDDCSDAEGDCLPPDALVWTLDSENPVPVSEVKVGMKVLTVDMSLTPPVTFQPLQRVSMEHDGQKRSWVRVTLAEGEVMEMTADHPVFPTDHGGQTIGPLKAENLVPGADMLPVLAVRPVLVQTVVPMEPEEVPSSRVRLKLAVDGKRGKRTSPRCFLASMPSNSQSTAKSWGFVALGDAQIHPAPTRLDALLNANGWDLMLTGTVGLSFVAQEGEPALRRSSSDSLLPTLRAAQEMQAKAKTKVSSTSSVTSVTSDETSKNSAEENNVEVEVIVGAIDAKSGWTHKDGEWYRTDIETGKRSVKLSDLTSLPLSENGTRVSMGSLGHVVAGETCKVCVFNRKSGQSCRHGALCNFCHAEHKPYIRPQRHGPNGTRRWPEQSGSAGGEIARGGRGSSGGKGGRGTRKGR